MWFKWRSVGCRDAWCTGNSRPAKETKVDQNCSIKTRSKPISSGATSIQETWRDMLWTDQIGEAQFTELQPTSKRLNARNSLLPERDAAEQPQQWSQLTSSAPTVQDCASGLGLQSHLRVHRWDAERKHHRIWWTTTTYFQMAIYSENLPTHLFGLLKNKSLIIIKACW